MGTKTESPRVTDLLKDTAEQFVDLLTAQIKLARLELGNDLRALLGQGRRLVIVAPVILVGYAFLMAGAAVMLAPWLGLGPALLAMGGLQVIVGVGLCLSALAHAKKVAVLDRSRGEITRTIQDVTHAANATNA